MNWLVSSSSKELRVNLLLEAKDSQSCTGSNRFGAFRVSLLEGVTTLALLGDAEEGSERKRMLADSLLDILAFVSDERGFLERDVDVSVFETVTRVIGSLLSIHDITEGSIPSYHSQLLDKEQRKTLLEAATLLGQRLLPAFASPFDLPYPSINLITQIVPLKEGADTSVSQAGTALLEFSHLSALSGEHQFRQRAEGAAIGLFHQRNLETGLFGSRLMVETGQWKDARATMGTETASYFEYLCKYPHLLRPQSGKLASRWQRVWVPVKEALEKLQNGPRWEDAHMATQQVLEPHEPLLGAIWPSFMVLHRNLGEAERSFQAIMSLWQRRTALAATSPDDSSNMSAKGVLLPPPELAESAFYLFRATGRLKYQYAGSL